MICFNTSLITITILVVAICVLPAISYDVEDVRGICNDMLLKFCKFENNINKDLYKDVQSICKKTANNHSEKQIDLESLSKAKIDHTENQFERKEPGWSPRNPNPNDIGRELFKISVNKKCNKRIFMPRSLNFDKNSMKPEDLLECNLLSDTQNNTELQKKITKLKTKIQIYQKMIHTKNKQIQNLKTKNSDKTKIMVEKTNNNFLLKTQMRLMSLKKKSWRFKEDEKKFALSLYYNSPKGYTFMRKFLCLPTVRSLRRWLQNLNVACGINENILEVLKFKLSSSPLSDRAVSIVFDEMSIKQFISYNSQNDMFSGYEDFGNLANLIDSKSISPCNQALVIMLKGIKHSWKQVIGYFLSNGPILGVKLKTIISSTIYKINSINLIPKVIICDQGTNNQQLRKLLGVTKNEPWIIYEDNKIFFMYDTPHLLKSVRNNFKKYDFKHQNEIYSWTDIVAFYNLDKDKVPRLAPKLKEIHIKLPPFSPMRVCLAAQTFSHTVSSAILTLVSNNQLCSKAVYTAKFIKLLDNLFDVFNSVSFDECKVFRRPLSENTIHWKLLNEALQFFNDLEIKNAMNKQPPCITGWIANIICLKHLYQDLHDNFNFEYLLVRRLTQDCLESLFSVIRAKGGNNITPDSSKFHSAIRMCIAQQLLMPPINGNCEVDACAFLISCADLLMI